MLRHAATCFFITIVASLVGFGGLVETATAAVKAGAGVLVVAEGRLPALGRLSAPMIVVPDVLESLGKAGAAARARTRARIVAITDSEFAPVARLANVAVLVSAQSPSFFDTISPALAAAEVLVALLASRAGADVPKNVSRHEKLLREAGVFWTPGKRNQSDHE